MPGTLLNRFAHPVLDLMAARSLGQERDMLLPRDAHDYPQRVMPRQIQQPSRRHAVNADGIQTELRNAPEILVDLLRPAKLGPRAIRPKWAVRHAADAELLLAGIQELPADHRPHRGSAFGCAQVRGMTKG